MTHIDYNENYRLFWGVPVEQELADGLTNKLIKKFPLLAKHARFTKPENLHITIRFLGSVDKNLIPIIINDVKEVIQDINSFSVKIDKIGPFPSVRSGLLAAYVKINSEIKQIHELVERAMLINHIGEPDERSFKPHITLARAKGGGSLAISYLSVEECMYVVDELVLYQSKPTNAGSLYLPVHRFNFKKHQ